MVYLGRFEVDAASVEDLLKDPEGPVGRLIFELSEQASRVAVAKAHVFPGTPGSTVWRRKDGTTTSTAILPPGTMRDSVDVHPPQLGSRGGMFGGVDASGLPTVFVEHRPKGARQMRERYPFLTTGLESLEGTL